MIEVSGKVRVLIVEDNLDDAQLMVNELQNDGLAFTWQVVKAEPDFVTALESGVDVVLCDLTLPQFSASRVLDIVRERKIPMPVLVVSGTVSDAVAVDFMRKGACDCVLKDRLARLGPAVRNALDRFRLEREAVEANSRLSRLMDELGVGAVTTDANGNVLSCNDVVWRMLGYESAAGFRAVSLATLHVDPSRRAQLYQILAQQGRVHLFDIELKRADGSTLWTAGEYRAVKDSEGKLVGLEALLIDSTERKRAEQEVKTTRERLDDALRNAPIVVETVDQELRFTFAGGAALEQVGLNAAAMLGTSAREVFKERPDIVRMFERAVAGEEFVEETEFAGRYFHVKFAPIGPNPTHAAGAAIVGVDITSRHEAEVSTDARARQKSAARKLAQEALDAPPIQQLMNRAVQLASEALDMEMAAVHEVELGGTNMRKLASIGYRHPAELVPLAGNALVEWLMRHSELRAVEDYMSDQMPRSPSLAREGVRAMLAVSIRDGQHTYGILSVSSRSPRVWTDDEREFVEVMGKTLWIAVRRQRLDEERRHLIGRLVDAQEQERRRIAADVHDDAVQVMSAVTMRLHLLAQHLTDPEQLAVLSKLQSNVSLSIERLRHLLFELNPPALERHGLGGSLLTLVDGFQRDFGIVTVLRNESTKEPDPASGLVIYRVLQEALVNVNKHAHAKHAYVTIRDADNGLLTRVEDDGSGFDPATIASSVAFGHMGLTSMRERAELAGGWWKLDSAPNKGTRVEFWIPYQAHIDTAA